jgi:hypothetical protein
MAVVVIIIIVIVVILILVGVGIGLYFLLRPPQETTGTTGSNEVIVNPTGETGSPPTPSPTPPPTPPTPPPTPTNAIIPAGQECERETYQVLYGNVITVDSFTTYSIPRGIPLLLVTTTPDATYVSNNNIPGNFYFNGINRSDQLTVNYLDSTFNNLVEDQVSKYPLTYTSISTLPFILVNAGTSVTPSFLTREITGEDLLYKYSFSTNISSNRLAQIVFSLSQGQLIPGTELLVENGRYQYSYYQREEEIFINIPQYVKNNLLVRDRKIIAPVYFYSYNTATIESIPSGQSWSFQSRPYNYYTYTYPMTLNPTRILAFFTLDGVSYSTTSGNFLLFGGKGYVYFTYRVLSTGVQLYLPYYPFVAPDNVRYNNLLVSNGSNAFPFELVTITS